MIGRLNHVAIAVPDLEAARNNTAQHLAPRSAPRRTSPITASRSSSSNCPTPRSSLLYPLGEDSPINGFLEKNPSGGIHHVCYEVEDILAARDRLKETGARVLGSGEPKIGAHGKPVLFLHPKDFNGTLVELEQV
jgi:methylmalonyl-CoA/ethylmalonyl-CoA epimerase